MSRSGEGGHPAPEELDLLLDGDPGGPQAQALTDHVRGCARCAAVLADLSDVRSLLRAEAARVPPPPADLGERLSAALAGAAAGPDRPEDARRVAGGNVVPLQRRTAVPRWLAVAAGLVVLGGTALTATELLGGGADTAVTAGTASDAGAESSAETGGGSQAAPAPARMVSTGTDYRPEALRSQVDALLAGEPMVAQRADPDAFEGGAEEALPAAPWSAQSLAGCLEALGAAGQVPEVVDLATWQGHEVAVIVLAGAEADRVDRHAVWVVERTCRPGDDGLVHYESVTE